MFTREIANEQIADRVREAEVYRMGEATRVRRAAEQRGAIRRVAAAAVSVLLWPIRH